MKIQLAKGELTQCPEGLDLICGIPYDKAVITDREEEIVRTIYSAFLDYRIARRPLDTILDPQSALIVPVMDDTIFHPEIAVIKNGEEFPSWIVEFVDEASFDIAMMLKPMIYRDAGITEYWVVDSGKDVLYIFNLKKGCLVPNSYTIPQRIKVSIYKDFFISYSSMFKKA